jgi:hypothetical protein
MSQQLPKRSRRPKGNSRTTGKEQFYTPADTAEGVVASVRKLFPDKASTYWVEPAGGTGKFVDAFIRSGVEHIWACDIEPLHPRVTKADFLSVAIPPHLHGGIVVTNPPFGRNNSLSIPFFNRAASFADVIAFIVPRSWRKWSIQNRLHPNFHLVSDDDISVDYEDGLGSKLSSAGRIRTCIQIWERRTDLRPQVVVEDRGYIHKTTPLDADVSLTVFGRGCGTVRTVFDRIPNTTQMFLSVSSPEALKALNSVDFSRFFNHVAYTEALSIREINFLLNEYFDHQASDKAA